MITTLFSVSVILATLGLITGLECLRRDKNNTSGTFHEGFINWLNGDDAYTSRAIKKQIDSEN
ncbi:hypothetical protein [Oenococcus sp.]|uniref:hypothetical protein n=1 Tax=Oenococcus sp. TaxID=1979414 RepID=UPI0039E7B4F4